jgi:hypothetical protein
VTAPKIVRKRSQRRGRDVAFWVDSEGRLSGWPDGMRDSVESELAADGGWIAEESDAADCNTTLAALRAELMDSPAPLEGTNDG